MLAVEIAAPGGPDVLRPVQRPVPLPGVGEVLIQVKAAGVNRPDVAQRQGKYPPPPGASDLPGLEVAGVVAATGAGAHRWRLGERVCALVNGGGYAEYATAPEGQVLPALPNLTDVEAAALPETFFTVWANVFQAGRLRPAERLLVHGGASGIGTTAIQLATALGAEVFATAGSQAKVDACVRLGAKAAFNYREGPFLDSVLAATGGQGVDVVLDMIGGPYTAANLKVLRQDGRLVMIAAQGGAKAEVDLWAIMQRRLVLTGSLLRPRTTPEKATIAAALEARAWPLLVAGRVRPVIDSTFPLAQAAAAHLRLESGQHVGKVMLTVGQPAA